MYIFVFVRTNLRKCKGIGNRMEFYIKLVPMFKILDFYNKHMGGVYLADIMVTYYNVNRKTFKVWKKVTFNFQLLHSVP